MKYDGPGEREGSGSMCWTVLVRELMHLIQSVALIQVAYFVRQGQMTALVGKQNLLLDVLTEVRIKLSVCSSILHVACKKLASAVSIINLCYASYQSFAYGYAEITMQVLIYGALFYLAHFERNLNVSFNHSLSPSWRELGLSTWRTNEVCQSDFHCPDIALSEKCWILSFLLSVAQNCTEKNDFCKILSHSELPVFYVFEVHGAFTYSPGYMEEPQASISSEMRSEWTSAVCCCCLCCLVYKDNNVKIFS